MKRPRLTSPPLAVSLINGIDGGFGGPSNYYVAWVNPQNSRALLLILISELTRPELSDRTHIWGVRACVNININVKKFDLVWFSRFFGYNSVFGCRKLLKHCINKIQMNTEVSIIEYNETCPPGVNALPVFWTIPD